MVPTSHWRDSDWGHNCDGFSFAFGASHDMHASADTVTAS